MANILQAAKWAEDGKIVKRAKEDWVVTGVQKDEDPRKVKLVLLIEDILADDWEIAE